jgi:hypothetical protein
MLENTGIIDLYKIEKNLSEKPFAEMASVRPTIRLNESLKQRLIKERKTGSNSKRNSREHLVINRRYSALFLVLLLTYFGKGTSGLESGFLYDSCSTV